ncbi:transcriptional repressor p66-beta-like isoform X2 [Macrosteles quadrilineatus]|uniref:transcriptional repressor p66-beta-like isoform X2 n=1 Tax=Macrosteles quadrilineatus TaxID=74068 RepID=UPI0023E1BEE8|nr:transcriptional repressor p66-beta-like isoform X2 [Macrosteles quadrilineatus]
MPHFTKEDLSVIKTCYEKNGWHGKRLVSEFPEKGWSARSVNKAIKRLTTKGSIFGKKGRKRLDSDSPSGKKKGAKSDTNTVQDSDSLEDAESTACSSNQSDQTSEKMERMEVDEDASVVDLSVNNRRTDSSPAASQPSPRPTNMSARRSLRPRTELRSYAESPDVVVVTDDEPRLNGFSNGSMDSDSDDGEMPPLPPIKELSPSEVLERERLVRRLREELRNEEMKLVLLKKLRQSQQMKENIAVVPPTTGTTSGGVTGVSAPTVTTGPSKPSSAAPPPPPLVRNSHSKPPSAVPHLLRGQPAPSSRGAPNIHAPPPMGMMSKSLAPGMPPNMHPTTPTLQRGSSSSVLAGRGVPQGLSLYTADRTKDSRHSPAPSPAAQQDRQRIEDAQTPAQRQAAAKLALRKQLEKTLLQIPPPKPPPPEMHFIPNPSNTEFIYLLGLEYVVDFITKDNKSPPPPEPFKCSQCGTSFTPVWKWEKNPSKGKEPKVICEQCVTTNVKKALKAEHTNRLKTAFVKALQQEQEIEQRLAQGSPQPTPEPALPPPPQPKASTPAPRPAPTPPAPVTPPSAREHPLAKLAAESSKFNSHHAAAAQALHQQLMRGLPPHQPLPAHMLPFSPLLYPYQLAMAQAAGGKGPVAAAAANLVELQRQAADIQRQYLLDMIPSPTSSRSHPHSLNNWKT